MSEPRHIREIIADVIAGLINRPPQRMTPEPSWQQRRTALDDWGVPFSGCEDERPTETGAGQHAN